MTKLLGFGLLWIAAAMGLFVAPSYADEVADCIRLQTLQACQAPAVRGAVRAQSELAVLYWQGVGAPQDYAEAAKWSRKAADQGDALGEILLGAAYDTGNGLPQNQAEAFKWYQKAANGGDGAAQGLVGTDYYNGIGVPQDYVLAYMWLSLSAAQGSALATKEREEMVAKMAPSQIEKAQALAAAWKPTTGQ